MAVFPGAITSFAGFTSSHTLSQDSHAAQHNSEQAEIVATQTKIGTGSSTPASGQILTGTGSGTSSWAQANLTTMVTGTLPIANGGTGQNTLTGLPLASPAITGTVSGGATYSSPILTTPTIADFTNAVHTHATSAQGGQIPTAGLANSSVTADKLGTGATSAFVATAQTTSSITYTDLATVGPAVTVTVGVNGLLLVAIGANLNNDTGGNVSSMSFALSGANTLAAADKYSIALTIYLNNYTITTGNFFILTGLNPGSTTVTAKYSVGNAATVGTFINRNLSAIPF